MTKSISNFRVYNFTSRVEKNHVRKRTSERREQASVLMDEIDEIDEFVPSVAMGCS